MVDQMGDSREGETSRQRKQHSPGPGWKWQKKAEPRKQWARVPRNDIRLCRGRFRCEGHRCDHGVEQLLLSPALSCMGSVPP